MEKPFRLHFDSVPGASDTTRYWILEPLTPPAYSRVCTQIAENWRDGIMSSFNRREIFTFRDSQATVEHVLADLVRAGIQSDEVEVISREDL